MVVSAVCLVLALWNVPLSTLWAALIRADPVWILVGVVCQIFSVAARAERWRVILDRPGHFWDSVAATNIGFLFTNTLPARLGEVARVLVMAERTRSPIATVAVSAVIERLLDVATVLGLLVVIVPFLEVPDAVISSSRLFGAVIVAALVAVPVIVWQEARFAAVVGWVTARVPVLKRLGVDKLATDLIHGLRPLLKPRVAVGMVLWSIISWAFALGMFIAGLQALTALGSWIHASFMIVTLSFAVSVPSTPGFFGVYQFVGQQALAIGFPAVYDLTVALAGATIVHLLYFGTTTTLGFISLIRSGSSFGELWKRVSERKPAAQAV